MSDRRPSDRDRDDVERRYRDREERPNYERTRREDSRERRPRGYDRDDRRRSPDNRRGYESNRYDDRDRRERDRSRSRDYDRGRREYRDSHRDYDRYRGEDRRDSRRDDRDNRGDRYSDSRRDDRDRRHDDRSRPRSADRRDPRAAAPPSDRPAPSVSLPMSIQSELTQIMQGSKSSTFVPKSVNAHVTIATRLVERRLNELVEEKLRQNALAGLPADGGAARQAVALFEDKLKILVSELANLDRTLTIDLTDRELDSLSALRADMQTEVRISGLPSAVPPAWAIQQLNKALRAHNPALGRVSPIVSAKFTFPPHNPKGDGSVSGLWMSDEGSATIIKVRSPEEVGLLLALGSVVIPAHQEGLPPYNIKFSRPQGVVSAALSEEATAIETQRLLQELHAKRAAGKEEQLDEAATQKFFENDGDFLRGMMRSKRNGKAFQKQGVQEPNGLFLADGTRVPPQKFCLFGLPFGLAGSEETAVREMLSAYGTLSSFFILQREEDLIAESKKRATAESGEIVPERQFQGTVVMCEWTSKIAERLALRSLRGALCLAAAEDATPYGTPNVALKDMKPGYLRLLPANHAYIANEVSRLVALRTANSTVSRAIDWRLFYMQHYVSGGQAGMNGRLMLEGNKVLAIADGDETEETAANSQDETASPSSEETATANLRISPFCQVKSRCICLANVGEVADWQDEARFKEMKNDLTVGLEMIGNVHKLHMELPREAQLQDAGQQQTKKRVVGSISQYFVFVEFSTLEAASRARKVLDGQVFSGRRLHCFYFPERDMQAGKYDNPQLNLEPSVPLPEERRRR